MASYSPTAADTAMPFDIRLMNGVASVLYLLVGVRAVHLGRMPAVEVKRVRVAPQVDEVDPDPVALCDQGDRAALGHGPPEWRR